jgi:hypothetical protein
MTSTICTEPVFQFLHFDVHMAVDLQAVQPSQHFDILRTPADDQQVSGLQGQLRLGHLPDAVAAVDAQDSQSVGGTETAFLERAPSQRRILPGCG